MSTTRQTIRLYWQHTKAHKLLFLAGTIGTKERYEKEIASIITKTEFAAGSAVIE